MFWGAAMASLLEWPTLLRALSTAVRTILGLSLLFELFVSVVLRQKLLPPVPNIGVDYDSLDRIPAAFYWSRDLLFEGGRIQGVQGNANLLAMAALIGLIAFAVRWAARSGSRFWNGFWMLAAVAALALTRSSTVIVATAVVAVVAVFLVVAHRLADRGRLVLHLAGAVVLVGGIVGAIAMRAPLLKLLGKSADLTNRTTIWDIVFGLANQRPAAGWGWVSYWPNWVDFFHIVRIKGIQYYQAHDAWIDLYLQLGVIGVIVFGMLVLVALVRAWVLALRAEPAPLPSARPAPPVPGVPPVADPPAVRWPVAIAAPLLLTALVVQSLAESRLLIEIGFALLVAIAIQMQPHRLRTIRR
jgi:exopolysaccharide production protein ExoQ